MAKEWYETYGDRHCLRCGKEIELDERGNFCKKHASDMLMGVGAAHYPTIDDFIVEAEEVGVSKRIGRYLPDDIKLGLSRCFLLFNNTKEIFGFFYVSGVEVVVKEGTDLSAELKRRGIDPISVSAAELEPDRGCGKRAAGGTYVVSHTLSEEDMEKVMRDSAIVKTTSIVGPLVIFKEPFVWEDLNYTIRSFIYVNGDKIIAREEPHEWRWRESPKPELPTHKAIDKYFAGDDQ